MEGLPIGNGRLAAMIWGDESCDRISLNHEWLWRGTNRFRECENVSNYLHEVRDLLKQGDYFGASTLANLYFGGKGGISGIKSKVDPYQPAGDLLFTPDGPAKFVSRELDIENGVCTVERNNIKSFFIAHIVEKRIICHWRSNGVLFSGDITYSRVKDEDAVESCEYADFCIRYKCKFPEGIEYETIIDLKTDGQTKPDENKLKITNASYITAIINIITLKDGVHTAPDTFDWDRLSESHKSVFSKIMNRIELEIDFPINNIPTDERLALLRSGNEDPLLPLLYFHFGRYLMISSSFDCELPANLQGKWNDRIDPPWESDYHYDINLQMNYWFTESANLPECTDSLINYVNNSIPGARDAAAKLYGCRGVWLPLQTDAWGRATPEAFGWGVWTGAAPWIAWHFWQKYIYSGDLSFLRDEAYPFFKDIAFFYEDYLVKDEAGIYQFMPSQSPENRFEGTGMWPVSIGISAAMDTQLAYDAIGYAIRSAKILGVDEKQTAIWEEIRNNLPPFAIGSDGRLLEWNEEFIEVEPGHRHLSHLYGLFPSDLFNPVDRPAQYEAAVKSLEYRLMHGGGHTGWSRAWTSCLFARIGDSEKTWEHFYALLNDFATVSLLDLHPPRIFQIDGNFGAVYAVIEMLVQTWGGKTHLLRALPKQWQNGRLKGLKLPGGHTLDMEWQNGIPANISITIGYSGKIVLSGLYENGIRVEDRLIEGEPGTTILL